MVGSDCWGDPSIRHICMKWANFIDATQLAAHLRMWSGRRTASARFFKCTGDGSHRLS